MNVKGMKKVDPSAGVGRYYDPGTGEHLIYNSKDGSTFTTSNPEEALVQYSERAFMNMQRKLKERK